MTDDLTITRDGTIAILTIDRPTVANALSPELIVALGDAVLAADADPEVRAVIITGAGDKHFCAGVDIKAIRAAEAAGASPLATSFFAGSRRSLYEIVAELDVPTIAAINGAAVGGGFELALACDIIVADERASFGLPEARVGMSAQFASVTLPRKLASNLALDMLLTGAPIDAQEAYRRQLVVEVTGHGAVLPAALRRARMIAANAPLSLARIKRMVKRSREMPLVAALRLDEHPNPYLSDDRREGFAAFAEKRAPVWKGR